MKPNTAFSTPNTILTTSALVALGVAPIHLTEAVRARRIVRIRRGYYCLPTCDPAIMQSVRVGGLLTCISAAGRHGVWIPHEPFPHVWLEHSASRLRSPRDRWMPLSDLSRDGAVLHWSPVVTSLPENRGVVSVVDALIHLVRCQSREIAVAALDSALYEKKIGTGQLELIFRSLPRKYARLRLEIDARAMSGIETILRLAIRDAGLSCSIQVAFPGVGHVDLVVEGCVVIETDGRANHEAAKHQKRDYDRDLRLAILGFTVLRFNYRQVIFEREPVLTAIRTAVANHRGHSKQ